MDRVDSPPWFGQLEGALLPSLHLCLWFRPSQADYECNCEVLFCHWTTAAVNSKRPWRLCGYEIL